MPVAPIVGKVSCCLLTLDGWTNPIRSDSADNLCSTPYSYSSESVWSSTSPSRKDSDTHRAQAQIDRHSDDLPALLPRIASVWELPEDTFTGKSPVPHVRSLAFSELPAHEDYDAASGTVSTSLLVRRFLLLRQVPFRFDSSSRKLGWTLFSPAFSSGKPVYDKIWSRPESGGPKSRQLTESMGTDRAFTSHSSGQLGCGSASSRMAKCRM